MATFLSHAKLNENGVTSGGQFGDQMRGASTIVPSTGKDSGPLEVVTEQWYNIAENPWYVVLRHPNSSFANALANFAAAIAANENVGYDNPTYRYTLLEQLMANNWNLAAVAPCACDCSSMVRVCCMYAGTDPGDIFTGTEEGALNAIGFQSLRGSELTNPDLLKKGDILLRVGHTAIVSSVTANPDDPNPPEFSRILIWMGWTPYESTYEYFTEESLSRLGVYDGGKAYGTYMFDYRYGLVPFMQRCYNYDSSYYRGFKKYIDMGAGNSALINNIGLHNLFIKYAHERKEEFQYLQDYEAVDNYLTDLSHGSKIQTPIDQLIKQHYGYDIMTRSPYVIGTAFSIAIRLGSDPGYQAFANGANMSDVDLLNQAYTYMNNRYLPQGDNRWDRNTQGSQYQRCFIDRQTGASIYIVPYGGIIPKPEKEKGMPVWMMVRYHI